VSAIVSTHVLDLARGVPAAGIEIVLSWIDGETRTPLARAVTNDDGRTDPMLAPGLQSGTFELVFAVGPYFAATGTASFFEAIPVRFHIDEGSERYHVPLLLSPWGYSTYRGS
jgi:5-hydroxyisourate hydrolase